MISTDVADNMVDVYANIDTLCPYLQTKGTGYPTES